MNVFRKDFKLPSKNDYYTKIVNGENRIRFLSNPIEGWVLWKDSQKQCVKPEYKELLTLSPKDDPKYFVTFAVWNYGTQRIEIYELTQATVIKELEKLEKEHGSLFEYDVKLLKSGEKNTTRYMVIPCDPAPVGDFIKQKWAVQPIYLEAQYENGFPHTDKVGTRTKAYFEVTMGEPVEKKTGGIDVRDLQSMLLECSQSYQDDLKKTLASKGYTTLEQAPESWIARLSKVIPEERTKNLATIDDCPF